MSTPIDPESLVARLGTAKHPPVETWKPSIKREMALRITRDGEWMYQDSPIQRPALVRLLASVLRLDSDAEYYLVTPTEKLRIVVDDVPFLAVEVEQTHTDSHQSLIFRTNVNDIIAADADHELWVAGGSEATGPRPYIHVRAGLNARVTRPFFYALADFACQHQIDGQEFLGVFSGGAFFPLESAE